MNAPTYARLGLLLALVCGSSAAGPLIGGPARVVDGDTLEMAGEYVRLAGIDAPEAAQWCHVEQRPWHCGRQAAAALHQWIAGAPVQCYVSTYDRYGRAVATCTVAEQNMNAWLVRAGWALDWPRYSGGIFADEQAAARKARAGLWRGMFVKPWVWRHRQ